MGNRSRNLWLGFLEAGQRSTPVVRDDSMDTANPRTIYLYHMMRDKILEFQRDIVEPKLRELRPEESTLTTELVREFHRAKSSFIPRGAAFKKLRTSNWEEPLPDLFEDDDPALTAFDDDVDSGPAPPMT